MPVVHSAYRAVISSQFNVGAKEEAILFKMDTLLCRILDFTIFLILSRAAYDFVKVHDGNVQRMVGLDVHNTDFTDKSMI